MYDPTARQAVPLLLRRGLQTRLGSISIGQGASFRVQKCTRNPCPPLDSTLLLFSLNEMGLSSTAGWNKPGGNFFSVRKHKTSYCLHSILFLHIYFCKLERNISQLIVQVFCLMYRTVKQLLGLSPPILVCCCNAAQRQSIVPWDSQ